MSKSAPSVENRGGEVSTPRGSDVERRDGRASVPAMAIAFEGFPLDEETRATLYWLGDDYPASLARKISAQLAQDDPQGTMLALRCLDWPKLEIEADEESTQVLGVRAEFSLQIVMRGGDAGYWRLKATATYTATHLDRKDGGNVSAELDILEAEAVP